MTINTKFEINQLVIHKNSLNSFKRELFRIIAIIKEKNGISYKLELVCDTTRKVDGTIESEIEEIDSIIEEKIQQVLKRIEENKNELFTLNQILKLFKDKLNFE